MSVDDDRFEVFGDKATFALEIRHMPEQVRGAEPEDCKGSWGEWCLWVSDVNLCELRLETNDGLVDVQAVRWFLAPLFRWVIENWMPLLHEKRLPRGGRYGDSRPRSARAAYLSMLESAGDDFDRFDQWQCWAKRHSLRTASDGGIVPDIFIQRIEDDLEFSWGDRIQPGSHKATFLMEDGVTRAAVDSVARAIYSAVEWFLIKQEKNSATWTEELRINWSQTIHKSTYASALSWYLDSSPEPGPLTKTFNIALEKLNRRLELANNSVSANTPWLGNLSPEVAMFGDLSPKISSAAAMTLLAEYFSAQTANENAVPLSRFVSDQPAWATKSPWHNGYSLALEILDEVDPDPKASFTQIEVMIDSIGVRVREVNLGEQGPRGVALAGDNLRPTILVNSDNMRNSRRGKRFTLAHELCHILFDRSHARSLAHSSTPWASPSIEQRANAFAAMLLMPPSRAKLPNRWTRNELKNAVGRLADKLIVSRSALRPHLANIHEIGESELDFLLGANSQDL